MSSQTKVTNLTVYDLPAASDTMKKLGVILSGACVKTEMMTRMFPTMVTKTVREREAMVIKASHSGITK